MQLSVNVNLVFLMSIKLFSDNFIKGFYYNYSFFINSRYEEYPLTHSSLNVLFELNFSLSKSNFGLIKIYDLSNLFYNFS